MDGCCSGLDGVCMCVCSLSPTGQTLPQLSSLLGFFFCFVFCLGLEMLISRILSADKTVTVNSKQLKETERTRWRRLIRTAGARTH